MSPFEFYRTSGGNIIPKSFFDFGNSTKGTVFSLDDKKKWNCGWCGEDFIMDVEGYPEECPVCKKMFEFVDYKEVQCS